MKQLSRKDFLFHLLTGGILAIAFFIFAENRNMTNHIIDSLFVGGLIPFAIGSFRLVRRNGFFDLFIYSNRKIWGEGKKAEENAPGEPDVASPRQDNGKDDKYSGSYHDYVMQKGPAKPFLPSFLAGGVYLAVSLLLTWIFV